ncbi:MAG TPA: DUF1223 domain-containing protein [Candidatus Acidoferrales bacterium]|nr:DUF1223 domain-containing protein [Candidatus Acidoferrales bacterium]
MKQFSRRVARGALAVFLPAVAAVAAWAQASGGGQPPAKPADRSPVLVELFTSEGCPHCPEADALLERLYAGQSIEGAQIIALEEHVDYWDRQEWVDHYSSPDFTARQKLYADAMDLDSLYTPQMVVDGLVEFVGNNESRARATISALGRSALIPVRILPADSVPGAASAPPRVQVRLEARDLALSSPASVFLALAEDRLFSRVTGGSNTGDSWPHSSIARWFHAVGTLSPKDASFAASVALDPLPRDGRAENMRLIAFVQEVESRRVVALGAARLADVIPDVKAAAHPAAASPTSGAAPKTAPVSSKSF